MPASLKDASRLSDDLKSFRRQYAELLRFGQREPPTFHAAQAATLLGRRLLTNLPSALPTDGINGEWVIDLATPDGSPQGEVVDSVWPATWRRVELKNLAYDVSDGALRPALRLWLAEKEERARVTPLVREWAQLNLAWLTAERPQAGQHQTFYWAVLAMTSTTREEQEAAAAVGDRLWASGTSKTLNVFDMFGFSSPVRLVTVRSRLQHALGRHAELFAQLPPMLADKKVKAELGDLISSPAFKKAQAAHAKAAVASEKQRQVDERKLQQVVVAAQRKGRNQLLNPNHADVKAHRTALREIKAELIAREVRRQATAKVEPISPEEVAALEKRAKITFPSSYRALLLAFGRLGTPFFLHFEVGLPATSELKRSGARFPITAKNSVAISKKDRRRYYVDETGLAYLQEEGLVPKQVKLKTFALPKGARLHDGTLGLGPSISHNQLYLVLNGPHAGEVWVDSLGNDVHSVFGPAAPDAELLSYVAKSLHELTNGGDANGDWLSQ